MSTIDELRTLIDSLEEQKVATNLLQPNKWNFNQQTDEQLQALSYSRKKFGELYPIIVREIDNGYEIIDGEHRWRTAVKNNIAVVSIKNLGRISDDLVKEMMLVLNETRGNPDHIALAELVVKLKKENPSLVLPYKEKFVNNLMMYTADYIDTEAAKRAQEELKASLFQQVSSSVVSLCKNGGHKFTRVKLRRCKKCGIVKVLPNSESE